MSYYVISGGAAREFTTLEDAGVAMIEALQSGKPAIVAQRVEVKLSFRAAKRSYRRASPEQRAEHNAALANGTPAIEVAHEMGLSYDATHKAAERIRMVACPVCGATGPKPGSLFSRSGLAGHLWNKHHVRLTVIERQ